MSRQAAKEDFFISSFFPAVSLPHCFALLQKTLYFPSSKGLWIELFGAQFNVFLTYILNFEGLALSLAL
jgi:hypothetical protein